MEIGAQFGHRQAADELRQMEGMGPDIADTTGRPGNLRIQAPFDMRRIGGVFRGHPVLHEFDMDLVDLAQSARCNNFPSLTDQRIAGHHIGHAEYGTGGFGLLNQVLGFRQLIGQRLVTQDRNARRHKRLCCRVMHVVRCGDHDGVDTVFSRRLGRSHGLKTGIGAIWIDEPFGRPGLRLLRIRRQRADHHVPMIAHPRCHRLRCGDAPSPDNAKPQTA